MRDSSRRKKGKGENRRNDLGMGIYTSAETVCKPKGAARLCYETLSMGSDNDVSRFRGPKMVMVERRL
jgi:hypothetical protein